MLVEGKLLTSRILSNESKILDDAAESMKARPWYGSVSVPPCDFVLQE